MSFFTGLGNMASSAIGSELGKTAVGLGNSYISSKITDTNGESQAVVGGPTAPTAPPATMVEAVQSETPKWVWPVVGGFVGVVSLIGVVLAVNRKG